MIRLNKSDCPTSSLIYNELLISRRVDDSNTLFSPSVLLNLLFFYAKLAVLFNLNLWFNLKKYTIIKIRLIEKTMPSFYLQMVLGR